MKGSAIQTRKNEIRIKANTTLQLKINIYIIKFPQANASEFFIVSKLMKKENFTIIIVWILISYLQGSITAVLRSQRIWRG